MSFRKHIRQVLHTFRRPRENRMENKDAGSLDFRQGRPVDLNSIDYIRVLLTVVGGTRMLTKTIVL